MDFIFLFTTGDNKKSGWEDNSETIVQEQEVHYELLDVEDDKFYRGKRNCIFEKSHFHLERVPIMNEK